MGRFAAGLMLVLLVGTSAAQEWPQWRGPNRDGVAVGVAPPPAWPEKLTRMWKVKVGEGHSSPVVSGGRIFLLARSGDREVASALEPGDGKILWQQSYDAPYTMNSAATGHGKGPKSTPVVHGGRLFTLGISGVLSCFDASTGRVMWRKEFSGGFPAKSPLYGAAMSPAVVDGLLVAHVGGHGGGMSAAFDLDTGAEKWSWRGDGPGYASPVLAELGGVRQIVTQTQNKIVGLTTQGKLLWELPFRTPWDQNIVTPVVFEDLLIVAGLGNPTAAFRLSQEGGAWQLDKAWENRDAEMYMNSPVLAQRLLFGFAKRYRGRFFCLDPRTGKILWAAEPRTGDYASIVTTGETLLLLTESAELTVAWAVGERFEPVKKYTVAGSPTWAHVTPMGAGVLVKDADSLAYWTW